MIGRRRAVAELAGLVISPRQHRAVCFEGERVRLARRNRNDARAWTETRNLHRRSAVAGGGSATELAGTVVSPRDYSTVTTNRKAERVAGRQRPNARQ
jgi:hypothetical protein